MADHPEYAKLASAVHFSAFDLFGLGTGSGHLYYYSPTDPGPHPLLIFFHGAMGNLECYLYHWQLFAEPRKMAVVCPTFGFGSWYRPGGTETAEAAWRYAQDSLPVKTGPATIVGMSNGATAAVRLAAAHPEAVARLVLISPVLETQILRSRPFLDWARTHPPPLILEGDADRNVTPAFVERGVAALKEEGVKVDYRVFPGHDHFLMFSAREEIFRVIDETTTPARDENDKDNRR
jgi:pimeloyl-ACP methyl ester carboxylesterase